MNIWLSMMQNVSTSLKADLSSGQGLELQTGEVVYGTLLEMVDGETALLELKGKPVRAQTEVQMPAGSRIPLLVVGTRENGQLELKVITEETQPMVKPAQPTVTFGPPAAIPGVNDPRNIQPFIEKVIQNLGLSPSPLLKTISESLLQAKVSIQPIVLQTIETIVQQELTEYQSRMKQQKREPESAEIQLITNRAINILTSMAQKQIPLLSPTYQAMKTLWYGPSLQQMLTNPEFPVDLRYELLNNFSLDLSRLDSLPTQERGQMIASFSHRMGLDHEARLTSGMLTQPQQMISPADTLKSVLLSGQLQQPESRLLEQAVNHLTGQQLMHSTRDEQSPFFYQYIAFPMSVNDQTTNANIHVLTRKKGNRQLDPNNCYLYLQLTMPSLGEIGIHVQVLERLVAFRLVTEMEDALALMESDLNVLKAGLEQAGYQLGTIRKETGFPDRKAPFSQLPIAISGSGMDFRI